MRIAIAAAVATALLAPGLSSAAEPKTDEEKTIYALGYAEGQRVQVFAMSKAEQEIFKKALTDSLTGAKSPIDMAAFGPKIGELAKSRSTVAANAVKAKGQEFLDKAAKEPGAQKLPSGLVIKDLKPGTGPSPKDTDTVKVNYRGTLIDGTEFDSSYKRNAPAEFPLKNVIPCWTEGVQKMKVGGKARLVCPSAIAYGDGGHPPTIPGGATLIFEVELLDIKGAAAAPKG